MASSQWLLVLIICACEPIIIKGQCRVHRRCEAFEGHLPHTGLQFSPTGLMMRSEVKCKKPKTKARKQTTVSRSPHNSSCPTYRPPFVTKWRYEVKSRSSWHQGRFWGRWYMDQLLWGDYYTWPADYNLYWANYYYTEPMHAALIKAYRTDRGLREGYLAFCLWS